MATPSDTTQTSNPVRLAVSTYRKWPSKKHFQETVTLLVGKDKKAYTLHKELLCFYSDYFRAAFNGSFKEASEAKIELLDADENVFESFQVWLYTRTLRQNDNDPESTAIPSYIHLARLWIFGNRYQIPLLQNNAIDAIFTRFQQNHVVPLYAVSEIYANTTDKSLIRKVFIDIIAYNTCLDGGPRSPIHTEHLQRWTSESLLDLVHAMDFGWTANLPRRTMPTRDRCYYHIHNEGERCESQ